MKNLRRFSTLAILLLLVIFAFLKLIKGSIWDGTHRFTMIIQELPGEVQKTKSLAIFSIEPVENRAIYTLIPANVLLEVPYGYNNYQAASIYQLGELDKGRGGGRLLTKSIEATFGIAVDGYLVAKEDALPYLPKDAEQIKQIKPLYFSLLKGIFSLPSLLLKTKTIHTNLSFMDKWRLWNAIRKIRIDQISFSNLIDNQALKIDHLPDGTEVMLINRDLIDSFFSDHFQDARIREENISLEVVNATDKEGLANEFSRILEHMGANVVLKNTAKEQLKDACYVYYSKDKVRSSAIVTKLRQFYKCVVENVNNGQTNLSDVRIVLGEGYIK